MEEKRRVAVYARCSTNEARQDVQSQIDACLQYCKSQQWEYEVFTEYESAYRIKRRPIFEQMLQRIQLKEFDTLLVYMLDRFSRMKPTQIVSDLHTITDNYGARFICLKESIDSDQPMWEIIMMVFAYMANSYSKMLGIRVSEGIRVKKSKNEYHGGRPKKHVDLERLRAILSKGNLSVRKTTAAYNDGLPEAQQFSHQKIHKAMRSLSF